MPPLSQISTNALIACLRAVIAESRRAERKLAEQSLTDEAAEELGLYALDLGQALAWMVDEYEAHRLVNKDLPTSEHLLHALSHP